MLEPLNQSLGDGGLGVVGALLFAAIAIAGGTIGGLAIGARDLGFGLASKMGGVFGPLAAVPAGVPVFVVLPFVW